MFETENIPHKTIGRIAAIVFIALAVAYGIGGSAIDYSFASDPLGPRVFPVALSVVLGVLGVLYLIRPGTSEGFPSGRLLLRVLAVPAVLVVCVALFEPAGFAISIFLLTLAVAMLFGAPLKWAVAGGIGHAILWWFVFDWLLEVYLPVGLIFG
ncbi:tripartite tricarboxylate transporter TctB family protein [Paenirhodobacter enshiensis]|uniref:tripartite tricarboxylate transporter TctB family protein n=1 Tax=Paenirhodobacter enshiensis TaxID=1105367 RepID=UPI00068DC414|nr:tripartite tricarboxylate transporter TctB family protein [Paenirhodobacter enshiensis]